MPHPAPTIRKAAVLVASVEPAVADAWLCQIAPHEAELIRRAASRLGPIDASERDAILAEFHQLAAASAAEAGQRAAGNSESNRNLPTAVDQQPGDVVKQAGDQQASESNDPMAWLHEAESDDLAEFLAKEHPQTAAVVFARMSPNQAADVLAFLSEEMQIAVLRRLSNLDEADSLAVQEIEDNLRQWLAERVERHRRRSAGVATVTRILQAAPADRRRVVLETLARADERLASWLSPKLRSAMNGSERQSLPAARLPVQRPASAADAVSFDDLLELDETVLLRIIRAADRQTTAMAMAGTSDLTKKRLLRGLTAAEAFELRQEIEQLGSIPARGVQTAQRQVVALALELHRRGQVDLTSHHFSGIVA